MEFTDRYELVSQLLLSSKTYYTKSIHPACREHSFDADT